MMKKLLSFLCTMLFVFVISSPALATLYDGGGGLIYDDVLEITWLQDANYARSELNANRINEIINAVGSIGTHTLTTDDFSLDGKMTWWGAMAWADQLVYGGYNDWRLPWTLPVNGISYNNDVKYDGSTDVGCNVSAPGSVNQGSTGSEMANMYYNSLGNLGYWDIYGNWPQTNWGLQNIGSFINIEADIDAQDIYWSSTICNYVEEGAWHFRFYNGYQDGGGNTIRAYAWAVRGEDLEPNPDPIPEPTTMLLLGSGLIGLAGFRRKMIKRKQ